MVWVRILIIAGVLIIIVKFLSVRLALVTEFSSVQPALIIATTRYYVVFTETGSTVKTRNSDSLHQSGGANPVSNPYPTLTLTLTHLVWRCFY